LSKALVVTDKDISTGAEIGDICGAEVEANRGGGRRKRSRRGGNVGVIRYYLNLRDQDHMFVYASDYRTRAGHNGASRRYYDMKTDIVISKRLAAEKLSKDMLVI
jgi:hypothetical protein